MTTARWALGLAVGVVVVAGSGCGGGDGTGREPDRCAGVVCTALDACHDAGTCDPATGACSTPNAPDDTACDDGDPDTAGDVCTSGVCAGVDHCLGVTCEALDACHEPGVCDHAFGTCSTPARTDGTPCDDANGATVGDACTGGVCAGVDHCLGVTCTASDQCHDAGICDHATGACSDPAKTDATDCDDGDSDTTGDVCTGGACAGVDHCLGVTCPPPDPCHDAGSCVDHATGACSYPDKADGTACDDGDANTANDVCTGGACAGVDHCLGVVCPPPDPCHDAGSCVDHATGACSYPDKADGTACDDGDANTANDVCTGGACAGVDHCAGVVCPAPDDCHEAGVCLDHATGECFFPEQPDGTECAGLMPGPCFPSSCSSGTCQESQLPAGEWCGTGLACTTEGQCLGPPVVASTDPPDGATTPADTRMSLWFDPPVEFGALTAQTSAGGCTGTVQVSLDGFATCVAFSASVEYPDMQGYWAIFTPSPGLLINREYQLRVTTGVVGHNGLATAAPYVSSFLTTNLLFGGAHNESNAAEEVAYCALVDPPSILGAPGSVANLVGTVDDARYTGAGGYASLVTQVGYGPATANPEYESGWVWSPAAYVGRVGSAARYSGAITLPASGSRLYAFRVSLDGGWTWTYCDSELGPSPGAGSNVGATFDLTSLNSLTVQ